MIRKERMRRRVLINLIIFLVAAFIGCNLDKSEKKKFHVYQLINYLKLHEVDTSIFNENFFNSEFKKKDTITMSLNLEYLKGFKKLIIENNDYTMAYESENVIKLSFLTAYDSKPLYFLVYDEGIESLNPIFKGDKIGGWL